MGRVLRVRSVLTRSALRRSGLAWLTVALVGFVLPASAQSPGSVPPPTPLPAAGGAEPAAGIKPASTPLTGLVTIESDLQKADNGTGVITATGNVRIIYRDQGVVATARQAQYFSREGRVVLSGDVEVVQEGGNRLLADRVVYLVEQERLIARPEAGQQVTSRVRLPAPAAATQAGAAPGSVPVPTPPAPVLP